MWKTLSAILFGIHQMILAENTPPQIYVYGYSWTPGFCNQQMYPGCMSPESYWETNFTIHGLWPQYTTTGYPEYCTTEPFDPNIPVQIGETRMQQYWPNVQYDINSPNYDNFWEHEWMKHGTCSGLSQNDYFQFALELTERIPTPSVLYNSIGKNMSASQLRYSLGDTDNYVALQCKNQMLVGAYTCWNQTQNVPSNQMECPMSVVKEDSCSNSADIVILELPKQN